MAENHPHDFTLKHNSLWVQSVTGEELADLGPSTRAPPAWRQVEPEI